MAQYRFSAQVIKRSDGRSAVAAAAYRAGERLVDERLDMPFDYRSRDGVEHTEIMAPEGTKACFPDRATLWNAVEAAEKRGDAQVAREVQISLPHELSFEQRRELVRDFVQTAFVDKGMVADIAMHRPDKHGDDRNFHAHIMLTTRHADAAQFGTKAREWNSREQLAEWRQSWAETQNRHLVHALGPEAPKVTHKSLADRGLDREATIHLGPTASAIERKGEQSERGDVNREIRASNAERRALVKANEADQDRLSARSDQHSAWVQSIQKELAEHEATLQRQLAGWRAEKQAIRVPQVLKKSDVRQDIVLTSYGLRDTAAHHLAVTERRVQRIGFKREKLASFVRDPQRWVWAKIREVHAVDRARRELARQRTAVRVREQWLRSDKGQAYILKQIDRSYAAAQPAKQQVRALERKIRRVEKHAKAVGIVRERLKMAEELGVNTIPRLVKPQTARQFVRHVDAGVVRAFSRFSPQQLQQAQQTVRAAARGITLGFTR
ncbi:MobA/MobL family protein [Sphingomonas gellani]|uniref:MobA/MobL family protein n=1 Tax=Sphingomonas gellani TaxID=1166340 RepID=A0A1H8JXK3_9SPHN|nr:MobQ family relaxase [Sphingomonas gellani]SEN85449.1 MobA/MobL family protein [Sphingomonas gellani]